MKTDDPKSIKNVLDKMDVDCAIRSVLSSIGGKKKFVEQFAVECEIMAIRTNNEVVNK